MSVSSLRAVSMTMGRRSSWARIARQHLEPVEVGQRQVEQHEIDAAAGGFDRVAAELHEVDLEPLALESADQWLRDRRVVLDEQDSRHRRSVEAASGRTCAPERASRVDWLMRSDGWPSGDIDRNLTLVRRRDPRGSTVGRNGC